MRLVPNPQKDPSYNLVIEDNTPDRLREFLTLFAPSEKLGRLIQSEEFIEAPRQEQHLSLMMVILECMLNTWQEGFGNAQT